ncbi:sn-glycerol-3-phosphate ABC transporter ATP-binding protein UgpC [Acuticoccus sediminis]|uniref:sn-glycerol-3-phosphate ABC transporter ATP-binding protein UgpC n=1 Tax=Acuticoccus sediminis TaxID=2184697 RepID=A0A8B2NPA2_9HYPH|nr:sn-glycerol-3-phosphate ABC transporter ATP-binding protein UgpC [Acuticoccus sediminis]RAI01725.1 sn-glycerol-3-phosphate ABC transporter ATP-binding protein UgpC [Acuticoccus sediminis]
MAEIALAGVHKSYGKAHAVRGVDLVIGTGEFLVILGPSGCGKSTLLRMIAGLEDITAGTVAIDGTVVNDTDPGRRGCAMVFQNYALYPHMSVAANLGYALKVAGVPRRERRERVVAIARMLELEALLERRPGQLSGGQRQRVAMGRAMIRSPKVFLFDEPLSNLDAKLRVAMRLEIKRLHRELKTTSIFVTHDQLEAMTMADRLVVMNGGRIEQIGTPQDIYRRPATHFVAGFIGTPAMNMLPAVIGADGRAIVGEGWCPAPDAAWDLPDGSEITLGVRPADLTAVPPRPGAPVFEADVVEDVGTELHVHARAAGADVTLSVPTMAALPDRRFAVTFAPEAAHAFDMRTGARAAPRPRPARHDIKDGSAPWPKKRLSYI